MNKNLCGVSLRIDPIAMHRFLVSQERVVTAQLVDALNRLDRLLMSKIVIWLDHGRCSNLILIAS